MSDATRTRVKICGITRVEDALTAVDAGADAIGLVFYPHSPRAVDRVTAQRIAAALPPFMTVVGLFVNAEREFIADIARQVPLDLLQFHGDEDAEQCEGFGRPWIKAIRMRPEVDLHRLDRDYAGAAALLLDAYTPGVYGGTGQGFAWQRIPADLDHPLVLAGGLSADNVGDAVNQVRPYAVDVSGGVEAQKGIKDPSQITAFVRAVQQADRANTEE